MPGLLAALRGTAATSPFQDKAASLAPKPEGRRPEGPPAQPAVLCNPESRPIGAALRQTLRDKQASGAQAALPLWVSRLLSQERNEPSRTETDEALCRRVSPSHPTPPSARLPPVQHPEEVSWNRMRGLCLSPPAQLCGMGSRAGGKMQREAGEFRRELNSKRGRLSDFPLLCQASCLPPPPPPDQRAFPFPSAFLKTPDRLLS